jgi:hypothetical protein
MNSGEKTEKNKKSAKNHAKNVFSIDLWKNIQRSEQPVKIFVEAWCRVQGL